LSSVVLLIGLAGAFAVGQACGGPSHAADTEPIRVEIHHSRFGPDTLSVRAGQTARIVVHNADPIDHELIVGDQATQDRHEHGVEDDHNGSVPGEVSVPAGAVVETTYHFDRPGQLLYGCHIPGHWAYGMRGVIRVSASGWGAASP
jgi:uncharacterized cupredoxin-like copper-binding protein